MTNEGYGTTHREMMKGSMAEPAGPLPVKQVSGWKEFLGFALWTLVALILCVMGWLAFAGGEQWLKRAVGR